MDPEPLSVLRAHGLQVTAQRLAVLRAVRNCPHGSVDQILEAVRAELGSVSTQAVYDALGVLSTHGIVRRVDLPGRPALYDPRAGDTHHHAVCRSCGAICDVDCARGTAPCLRTSTDSGYQIDATEIVYWGTCPSCQAPARRKPRKSQSR